MFHIEYNSERSFFTWSELRCLCRSLGFQPDLITLNLPSEVDQNAAGMTIKELVRIINLKYLDMAVDKTFNAHTADWNLCVFKKAIVLIDHRVLTYQQVHDIRVSFCAYEHQDLKGMEIDENTIIRCLKMCGRIIAPLKMHHRIKHMSQMFDEEGRIQFYEFLDLILWTELYNTHRPPDLTSGTDSKEKSSSLYQVEDFENIIQHYDERLAKYLNELYLDEEWSFGKEEFSKQKLPNELPVNRDFRLNNMTKSKKHYRHLKNQVGSSQNTVHLTSTGHVRPRPLTAPHLEKYEQSEKSSIYTTHSQHKLSVADMVRDYIQTPASRFTRSASQRTKKSSLTVTAHPKICAEVTLSVDPAVSSDDKIQMRHDMQDLKFHMSTLENRYDQKLQKDVEEYIPNYVPRPKEIEEVETTEVVPPVVKIKTPNPALLPEHIDRLAYPPYRPVPKRSHAQKCDARFRGWHKVKTARGQHFILTKLAFGDNPNSKQLSKLYNHTCSQVKSVKGDCVVRATNDETVRPEILRPASVPAALIKDTSHTLQRSRSVHQAAEPRQSSAPNPQGRSSARSHTEKQSRKTSAGRSTTASSGRTYSFKDFNIYAEEWEKNKPGQRKDVDASKVASTETSAPIILVHGAPDDDSTTDVEFQTQSAGTNRDSQSSVPTGNTRREIESKLQRVKQFADRRRLSAYAKKRLIDSAVTRQSRSAAISAC